MIHTLLLTSATPSHASPIQWFKDELEYFRSYPRLNKAQTYMAAGKYAQAKPLLEQAQAINPRNPDIAESLGTTCLALDDRTCVRVQIQRLQNHPEKAARLQRDLAEKEAASRAEGKKNETVQTEHQDSEHSPQISPAQPAEIAVVPPAERPPSKITEIFSSTVRDSGELTETPVSDLPELSPTENPGFPTLEMPAGEEEPAKTAESPVIPAQSDAPAHALTKFPVESSLSPPYPDAATLAYQFMNNAQYREALAQFDLAIEANPDSLQLHMDRVWAAFNVGDAETWVSDVEYALAREEEITSTQSRYILYGANRWAHKHWQGNLAISSRLVGTSTGDIRTRIKNNSYAGFAIAELGYRVFIRDNPSRFFLPYARAITSLEDQSLKPFDNTLQLGVGVSVKPFLMHNALFTGERIFSDEINGGDDWLLRASYSSSRGAEWRYDKDCWSFSNFYIDVAQFLDAEATYITSEYRHGIQKAGAERWTFNPYWMLGAAANNDNAAKATSSRFDVGGGLGIRYYSPSNRQWSYRVHHHLGLEARTRIAGNAQDDYTVQLRYQLYY